MTKHGAPISARLITTQGQEPGVAAVSIRISTDHPSTHLMVLNVSCIQAKLLKPMIEWKQAHPLLKATLTGFRKTYLRFLVFRPKLAETKRFPPILVHMNGKIFPGGSRFPSAKIDLKLAVGGSRSHNNGQEQYWKLITLAQKDDTFRHQWTKNYVSGQVQVPNI